MKHLIYLVLILLLTRTVAPTGTGLDKAKRLFSTLQTQMAECPKERTSHPFYTCPSRFWPEILQTFVPIVKDLEEWIRQRISVDDAIWLHLARSLGFGTVKYGTRLFDELGDEIKVWILLNHYLQFDKSDLETTHTCLLATLDSLTGADLRRVSRLPYGGNSDLFGEINEIVNDPKKARLLDGLKRASRNDFEMSHMLRSLRRGLKRPLYLQEAILPTAFKEDFKIISFDQLRARSGIVSTFKEDQELPRLFELVFAHNFYNSFEENESLFHNSLPQSFPNRDHLVDFLTKLGHETKKLGRCKLEIEYALQDSQGSTNWDKVVAYNECVMTGLSELPDEFFEEYSTLDIEWRTKLRDMLRKANLPPLFLY